MMTSSNIKTFSALLALCVGNSPVTGEFPSQRPVTWSFDIFFDPCLNILLSHRKNRNAGDLRRHRAHYDVTEMFPCPFLIIETLLKLIFNIIETHTHTRVSIYRGHHWFKDWVALGWYLFGAKPWLEPVIFFVSLTSWDNEI